MMRDGKPDHEAAPHARYKQELAARADAFFAQMQPQAPAVVKKEEPMPALTNPFEISDTAKPIQQPDLQPVEVPVAQPAKAAPRKAGIQMQAPSTGGMTFAKKQETGGKAIGAKKIDVNFDSDDFFNSFQQQPAQEVANSN